MNQLEAQLQKLKQQKAALEQLVELRAGSDLQQWRQNRANLDQDRRWNNPSMRAQWQKRELEHQKEEFWSRQFRRVSTEWERLQGKIQRLEAMLEQMSDARARRVARREQRNPVPPRSATTPVTMTTLGPPTLPTLVPSIAPGSLVVSAAEASRCLHPTLARLLAGAGAALPATHRGYLHGFVERHGAALDAAIRTKLSSHLQMVELFAGIGGLGLGLEAALGAVTVLQAERVPERRAVLHARFPLALQLDDVHRLLELDPPCDPDALIVCGGFPCRGASQANLTGERGLAHAQTGLWSVFAEVVRRWRPLLVCFENVRSIRSRGLEQVLRDLDGAGFDIAWGTLTASQCGAPHERARMFGVALRREHPRLPQFQSRRPRPEWMPWGEGGVPANDYRSAAQQARVQALGDAVVPIVAYNVGLTAASLLRGDRPLDARPFDKGGHPPMHGWLENGVLFELPASPFPPVFRAEKRRWVTIDERFENPQSEFVVPPAVGLVHYENGDLIDVELPGGEIEPFPVEWVRDGWPTPTATDGHNKGSTSQYCRNAPGLNALAQADCCPRDEVYGEALLEDFSGRGVGPAFLEWLMGFSRGHSAPIADPAAVEAASTLGLQLCAGRSPLREAA